MWSSSRVPLKRRALSRGRSQRPVIGYQRGDGGQAVEPSAGSGEAAENDQAIDQWRARRDRPDHGAGHRWPLASHGRPFSHPVGAKPTTGAGWRRGRDSNPRGRACAPVERHARGGEAHHRSRMAEGVGSNPRGRACAPVERHARGGEAHHRSRMAEGVGSNPRGRACAPVERHARGGEAHHRSRMAEGVGFEPTVRLRARRFSRPVP